MDNNLVVPKISNTYDCYGNICTSSSQAWHNRNLPDYGEDGSEMDWSTVTLNQLDYYIQEEVAEFIMANWCEEKGDYVAYARNKLAELVVDCGISKLKEKYWKTYIGEKYYYSTKTIIDFICKDNDKIYAEIEELKIKLEKVKSYVLVHQFKDGVRNTTLDYDRAQEEMYRIYDKIKELEAYLND
jgi:hypothetical protein